jgi:hypothetical protein
VRCLVRVSLLFRSYNGKRKSKFADELKSEYSCFRNGHDE